LRLVLDQQAVLAHRGKMRAARDKADVVAGLCEPAAEKTAYTA
jgi:hypothetical protein